MRWSRRGATGTGRNTPATRKLGHRLNRYKQAVKRGLMSWAKWTPHSEYKGDGFWTERHVAFGLAHHLHAYELLGGI